MASIMKPAAALLVLSAVALAGCTAAPPAPAVTEEPPAPSPTETAADYSLGPVAPDVLLVITATATAPDGAALDLELWVRPPVPFDDIGGYTVPAAAIAACPDTLSQQVAAQQLWTFTRVNVSAISQGATTWPADQPIALVPSSQLAPIASMSFLGEVPGDRQQCQLDKFVPGQGKGAVSIGTPQDATDPSTGGYHRWAGLDYGFVTTGTDVVLTDCTFTLTQAGTELGGGAGWASRTDAQNCVTGASSPVPVY